jgi:integrase
MKNYRYQRGKQKVRYTRRGINDNLKQIHAIWGWGVGREVVTHAQAKRLEEVKSLRLGHGFEVPKRPKITSHEFEKVTANVTTVVADMLRMIWYTAMRPGEVCKMRPFDILRDDPECWIYVPGRDKSSVGEHKTTRFGRMRIVPLTAKSQEILNRRITDFRSKNYIFRPVEAIEEMYKKRAANRLTPLSCGNRQGTNRKKDPMIKPGERYTTNALRIACRRGCVRASVEPFKPYDLRRSVATGTRSILGKEAAKVLLGHVKTDTTDIYLLEEVQEAMKVAKLLASKI